MKKSSLKNQLLKGAAGSIGIRAYSSLASLFISIYLARHLGASDFGLYSFAISVIMLIAIPASLGVPELTVRETAKTQAHSNWALLAGLWFWGSRLITLLSISSVLVSIVVCYFLFDIVDKSRLEGVFAGLILIPIISLINFKSACIRGLRHTILGQMPDNIVRTSMFLLFILVMPIYIGKLSPIKTIYLYIFSSLIALLVSKLLLNYLKPVELKFVTTPAYATGFWFKATLPLSLITGLQIINGYSDVIVLGLFRENNEVGIYKAVAQLSLMVAFGLQAINQVLHPHFSRLYSIGEHERLQKLVSVSARLIFGISLIPVILLIFKGSNVLSLVYGSYYSLGAGALATLAFGQLINSSMGSVGALLNMTGHERYTIRGVTLAAVVNIALNFILVPIYGMVGAAVASSISMIIWNLLLRYYVRKLLNIESSGLFHSVLKD